MPPPPGSRLNTEWSGGFWAGKGAAHPLDKTPSLTLRGDHYVVEKIRGFISFMALQRALVAKMAGSEGGGRRGGGSHGGSAVGGKTKGRQEG